MFLVVIDLVTGQGLMGASLMASLRLRGYIA
ncbi:MAG: hypothetical protein JWR44_460, partial [Hymenobacter sp.]|nr:hypothetical protein [Hymenobacter sp.]